MTSNNNSTSVDLGVSLNQVDQDKIDKFSLSKSLLDLLWSEPFYSRILRSLTKIESDTIPTAGVLAKEDDIVLWWNRNFLASLEHKHLLGVLKHECLHLVFGHTTKRRKDPHTIWNYATDLAINSIIGYDSLPDGCLYPGKPLPALKSEDIDKMSEDMVKNYRALSEQIASFPLNKTSEYYFEQLIKEGHASKLEEGSGDGDGDNPLGDFLVDDHNGWDEVSQEQREFITQKVEEILKSAAKEADSKGWGSVSAEARIELNKIISKEINWESILKRFCGFTRKADRTSSIRRLNKKYPGIHPGTNKQYRPTIAIYVDESGSMSVSALEKLYAELQNLSQKTDFYLYKFDTIVDEKNGFLWKKGKRLSTKRTLSGGTCFNAATTHALNNKAKFDGYIIFTDGGAQKPKPSVGLKRCYLVTPGDKLYFVPDKNDIVINIK